MLLSDTGNFKAALDTFYTTMIVNIIFLIVLRQFMEPWICDLSIRFAAYLKSHVLHLKHLLFWKFLATRREQNPKARS